MPDEMVDTGDAGADDDVQQDVDETTDEPRDADDDRLKKALNAERKQRRDLEKRARELEAKVQEFADRDKSETERATEARATAERERDEARRELSQTRREGWLMRAAADAKFIDTDDAVVRFLNNEDIESLDDASAAIAALAKAKPHLLGERPAGPGSFAGGQRGGGNASGGNSPDEAMNALMRGARTR